MTQGFDEWYSEAKKTNDNGFSAKDFYEAGAASRQAEIDGLRKMVDSIQEITSVCVYHIPTLIKDLKNALKGESNE